MKNNDIIICIAGKNDIAVNALSYLVNEINFSTKNLCVTLNKTESFKDTWQKSLYVAANKYNIKIFDLKELYEIENLIFISLEYDRIVNPENFKTKYLYNMHFSKLPKYKGMYTSVMPIISGETESGVTFHKLDAGIDTGDIIKQKVFPVPIDYTARNLYFDYLKYGFELFKEVIEDVLAFNIDSFSQPIFDSSYYSKKVIDFKNIQIDFNKTSFEIHNQVRAFIFPEYQLPKINNCEIVKSILTTDKLEYNYFAETEDKFIISGIDGYKIELYKLKQ